MKFELSVLNLSSMSPKLCMLLSSAVGVSFFTRSIDFNAVLCILSSLIMFCLVKYVCISDE